MRIVNACCRRLISSGRKFRVIHAGDVYRYYICTGNKYESFRSVIDILHMGMIYGLYMWVWIVVYESYGGLDME